MKIIQAMKKIKSHLERVAALGTLIKNHSAIQSFETPTYQDQFKQLAAWRQEGHDILKEVERLRLAIQRTNLVTMVTIDMPGADGPVPPVTKSIAAWVHRRRDLAKAEQTLWAAQTDRGLKEGVMPSSIPGGTPVEVKIVRFYSPELRDEMVEAFRQEPHLIDATLEVINAITDLVVE